MLLYLEFFLLDDLYQSSVVDDVYGFGDIQSPWIVLFVVVFQKLKQFKLTALTSMQDILQRAFLYALEESNQGILFLDNFNILLFLMVYVFPEVVYLLSDEMHHLAITSSTFVCFY